MTPFEFGKNTTGYFYCGRECMRIGHSKNYSGSNSPIFGKKHSKETREKMSGKNHWNYGNGKKENVDCPNCGTTFIVFRRKKP